MEVCRTSQEVRELKLSQFCKKMGAERRTSQEVRELKYIGRAWCIGAYGRTSQEVRELKSAGPCGGRGLPGSHLARGA